MKYLLYLLIFASFSSFAQMDSIFVDGMHRKFLVHLPDGYDGTTELSLVLGFHGGFGNAEQFETQSQLSEKADEANFIVIYPDGLGFPAAPSFHYWNAGVCCGYPYINDIDDVNFIRNLIDTVVTEYAINEDRVYATGMSNGAFMVYRLACELSDKIAAIAPVAGGMIVEECPTDRPVPVIHFHSYLDENIPYDGGVGDGFTSHHNPPLDSVCNAWAGNGSCSTINDTIHHGADYTFVQWTGCECESEVNYYITTDGGHSWPGGNATGLGDPVSEILNANDLMWDFFQEHDLNCGPSGIAETSQPDFQLYPNPATEQITVAASFPFNQIQIVNIMGQEFLNIKHLNTTTYKMDLMNLEKGIYIVVISNETSRFSQKITVQ